jgi:dTMP kinase
MVKLLLSEEERAIVDILNLEKNEKKLPAKLPSDFIINNRICYLLYEKVGEELECKFSPKELEQIREKAENMNFLVKEAYNLSKIFKSNNIDFVLIFRAIRSLCDSTDIDVIVKRKQDGEIKGILKKLDYFNTVWGGDRVYVCSRDGNAVQIDIAPEEDKQPLFDEGKAKILSNKNMIKGIYVPSSDDELITLILKSIIGCRPIRLSDILHISNLLKILKECDVDYIRNNIKKGWFVPFLHYVYIVNTIYESLYNKRIESPLVVVANELHDNSKILKLLSKIETRKLRLPFYSTVFTKSCLIYKLFYDIKHFRFKDVIEDISMHFTPITGPVKLLKSALSRKRIFVCFTGMDGTGKTSHATKLVDRFKSMGVPCQYVWYGLMTRLSYPLMAFIYLVTGGYRRKDYHKSKILKRIWNYIVILDFLYLYPSKIKFHLLIGKNVICDRYVYDWMADLMYDGLYNERASKILLKLIPKPDLVFMLDIPEVVSNSRKDDTKDAVNIKDSDNAVGYLRIHRKNYLKIANSLNIPVIDATKEIKELNEEFYTQIIQIYINKQKQENL